MGDTQMNLRQLATGLLFFITMGSAHAGVVIGGTRVIYDGSKKEASINVSNPDKTPYLIQSWVDEDNGSREGVPFIVTPPLFRLDGAQQNVLRIIRAGGALSEQNESLYWLNIKSIPSSTPQQASQNTLQIAVKTRIKLIYRPEGLKSATPEDVTKSLKWEIENHKLKVINPTGYYMNFNLISVNGAEVHDPTFVAPKSSALFELPSGASGRGTVMWKLISDYGGIGDQHASPL